MSPVGPPTPPGPLGREHVLAALRGRLDRARAGAGGAALVVGPPGSGRTTVLAALAELAAEGGPAEDPGAATGAPGARVLSVHLGPGEQEWPLATVGDLTHRLRRHLPDLPGHLRRALEQVADPSGATAPGPVASGLTALLAEAASERALVVAVDDAHWLDEDSAAVLSAVSRRLVDEPVLVVLAGDPAVADAFPSAPAVRLEPLEPDDADVVVTRATDGAAAPVVRAAIVAAAGGNPLALVELSRALTTDELAGRAPIGDPLPVGPLLEKAALAALPAADHRDRAALVALAVAGDLEVPVAVTVGGALGAARGWLDRAEADGAVVVRAGRAGLSSSVARSALVHGTDPVARRAAHLAVADALPAADPRALRHRAEASPGPDEDLAAALLVEAEEDRRRGALVAAAAAAERAAELTPDPSERAHRALVAARAHREAGHDAHVRRLLEVAGRAWAEGAARDGRLEAEVAHLQAVVLLDDGPVDAALEALRRASVLAATESAAAGAAVLLDGVPTALRLGRVGLVGDVLADARRILDTAPPPDAPGGPPAGAEARLLEEQHRRAALAEAALAVAAGGATAVDDLRAAVEQLRADGLAAVPYVAECAGLALVWAERYDDARILLDRLEGEARAAGAPAPLATVRAVQGYAGMRQGRLADAAVAAAEAVRASEDSRRTGLTPFAHAVLAVTEALRGDAEVCRSSAEWLLRTAGPGGDPRWQVPGRAALGLLALGEGRVDDAVAEMAPLLDVAPPSPWLVMWEGDLAEALVRAGRPDDARPLVDRLETGPAWRPGRAAAVAERLRGLLATDTDEALGHLRRAARLAEAAGVELGRGRALLNEGQVLRRARRRAEARRVLDDARCSFASIGAGLWERVAVTELRACGAPVSGADPATLTPQELQVARMVAAGASNREVAEALFISARTVESHLGRTYRKLGLRSRAELAARPEVLEPPAPPAG